LKRKNLNKEGYSSQESRGHGTTYNEGRPAGRWRCPSCGNSKRKEEGFKRVPCRRCGTEMSFIGEGEEASQDVGSSRSRFSENQGKKVWKCGNYSSIRYENPAVTSVRCTECGDNMRKLGRSSTQDGETLSRKEALSCVHDYTDEGLCRKCGWARGALRKINTKSSGCAVLFQLILAFGGLWLAMQTCGM
jgi:hypothetical protein